MTFEQFAKSKSYKKGTWNYIRAQECWEAATASHPASAQKVVPVAEPVDWRSIESAPVDEGILIAATPDWVGEARLDLDLLNGVETMVWRWASGEPIHPNIVPVYWMPKPAFPSKTGDCAVCTLGLPGLCYCGPATPAASVPAGAKAPAPLGGGEVVAPETWPARTTEELEQYFTEADPRYPARKLASEALSKFTSAWFAEYEFTDGENGYHDPSEFERMLIEDAFHGLTADDEYVRLHSAWRELCGDRATPPMQQDAAPAVAREARMVDLLKRGIKQMDEWHIKYGEHNPEWLPPSGDVRWAEDVEEALEARTACAPRHKFWGAGEPDCPQDLKAANGELHTMRCKVCGDGWRKSIDVCRDAAPAVAVSFSGFLCRAWGESDMPCAEVVRDLAGVRHFLIREWLGSEDDKGADGEPTLPKVMAEIESQNWEADEQWSAEFEIGGVSVEPVYSFAAPTAAVQPGEQDSVYLGSGASRRVQARGLQAKYNELLYAVGNKYPGESRHETALRYIRRAEEQTQGANSPSHSAAILASEKAQPGSAVSGGGGA
jgi:hypothetical protein